ncbi:hypothetical protein E4U58_002260 [Claviceps cyperi]|nr:hypothetical protein E4U58_002260 [Claviceps cyperi]
MTTSPRALVGVELDPWIAQLDEFLIEELSRMVFLPQPLTLNLRMIGSGSQKDGLEGTRSALL